MCKGVLYWKDVLPECSSLCLPHADVACKLSIGGGGGSAHADPMPPTCKTHTTVHYGVVACSAWLSAGTDDPLHRKQGTRTAQKTVQRHCFQSLPGLLRPARPGDHSTHALPAESAQGDPSWRFSARHAATSPGAGSAHPNTQRYRPRAAGARLP